jgi:hypothetical protein
MDIGHAQWRHPHANPANTSAHTVTTIPAAHPVGFADVGPIADGVNPVIATDGTLYIGNTRGELFALHPDGTLFWTRQLDTMYGGIFTSPVVAADGSIYVISRATVHDSNKVPHSYSYLHKFSPASAWLNWVRFPLQNPAFPDWVNGGGNSGAPNIWRFNDVEVIMVPVWYQVFSNWELRLIAFSTNLGVLAVQPVTTLYSNYTSDSDVWCYFFPFPCIRFNSPIVDFAGWPMPGVAIWENAGGSPWIWLADNKSATVAYKFDLASGFFEVYRFSDNHNRQSSPPVALDMNTVVAVVGTDDGRLKFEHSSSGLYVAGIGEITAAPTRLLDGRLVAIARQGLMSVVSGAGPTLDTHTTRVTFQSQLNGESIASAAASCTHLFVASQNELVTFDLKTMLPVVRVPWTGGGQYAPVIGPLGHVYGMTSFGLFVFPPPATPVIGGCQQAQSGPVL